MKYPKVFYLWLLTPQLVNPLDQTVFLRLDTSLLSKNGSIPWSFLAESGSKLPEWIFGLLAVWGDFFWHFFGWNFAGLMWIKVMDVSKKQWLLGLKKNWSANMDEKWEVMETTCSGEGVHHPFGDLDVSKNRGTPKRMVCNGKPYWNGWFWGTIIFGNTHLVVWSIYWTFWKSQERLIDQLKEPPASQHAGGEWFFLQTLRMVIHYNWLVVSNIFGFFTLKFGEDSHFDFFFLQMGWNHQLV